MELVLLLVLFVVASGSNIPAVSPLAIPWSPDRPIGWEDFLGELPTDAAGSAQAAAIDMTLSWRLTFVVEYDPGLKRWRSTIDADSLDVTNVMDPSRSWVAPDKRREEILNHEQRHFDLNEVYRRKLLAALPPLAVEGASVKTAKEALQEKIHTIASQILRKLAEVQERYDEETAHGTNQQEQAAWDEKIARWLVNPGTGSDLDS